MLIFDLLSEPDNQYSSLICIGIVKIYQSFGRPVIEGRIKCRYVPSCSNYSVSAFQKYGTFKGLILTYERIQSCKDEIPIGMPNPLK